MCSVLRNNYYFYFTFYIENILNYTPKVLLIFYYRRELSGSRWTTYLRFPWVPLFALFRLRYIFEG